LVKQFIFDNLSKIYEKKPNRTETLRNQIARIAKGIPLHLLYKLQPPFKFKTATKKYNVEAYFITFLRFLDIVDSEIRNNVLIKINTKYGSIDNILTEITKISSCY